MTVFSEILAQS